MNTRIFARIIVCCAVLLSACAAPPRPPAIVTPVQPAMQEIASDPELPPQQQIVAWLVRAEQEDAPLRQQYQLQAAELLMREQQIELSSELLDRIDTQDLPPELLLSHSLLRSRILRADGLFDQAINLLTSAELLEIADLAPLAKQIQLSQLRASLHSLQGQHLASAQERIYIDPLLQPGQRAINHDGIWRSLDFVSVGELFAHLHSSHNRDYLGWLELAAIAKDNQGDIDTQLNQLKSWQQRWYDHPAAANLPGGLAQLEILASQRPQQLALLLPVSGRLAKYGKAIRDGFMASYFQTQQRGSNVPRLRLYDTAATASVPDLYQQAVNDGAELVIGPLTKEALNKLLSTIPELPVQTLALNRIQTGGRRDNFFQFGLAPEDEARQLADIAHNQGYQRALVLTPDNNWGRKLAETFTLRWQELDGESVASAHFNAREKNYSKQLRAMLHLDLSQRRADQLKRITGKKLEYEPRRRTDADFIFMLARPAEARAIKPLLAFHYAGDLPVLATSHVYGGIQNADLNKDVEGVQFVDLPWLLSDVSDAHRQILNEFPRNASYNRMYALGTDSFRLYSRLQQLAKLENSRVYGETGTLKLNDLRQVERTLLLGEFRNGLAKVIPITDNTLDREIDSGIQNAPTRNTPRWDFNR